MSRRFCPCHAGGHAAIARSRMVFESVGHHRRLGRVVDAAEAVAPRAGALRRVRRERLGVEHRLPARVVAGPRVEHAQQVGERRHAADADERVVGVPRCCCSATAGGRPSISSTCGDAHLVEQPPRVRDDRLQVPPLRLGVERAERQRRFARSRRRR